MNKKYTLKIIDDERYIISRQFNTIKNTMPFIGQKRSKNYNEVMSRKEYARTIKRWCNELWEYKIDSNKCRFITLTLDKNLA